LEKRVGCVQYDEWTALYHCQFVSDRSHGQPRYALSSMILSITVMAISLIQLAYTGGKEEVSWQWKGWIPWFYHQAPSNKLFGHPVHVVKLLFSVSQCVSAIIAYHYLSRYQNNPTQFSVYPIAFAFCLLCLSFRRREP